MKIILFAILLISMFTGGLNTITKVNQQAKQAAAAYERQDFVQAIATYTYLLHDLEVEDDQLQLNLAHAYYRAGELEKAQQEYQLLADHPAGYLRAVVHLQLGNIACAQTKYKHALALYKQALIVDPANETARYNYELLKKYLDLHPEKAEPDKKENLPENTQEDNLNSPPPAAEEMEPQPKKNPDPQGTQEAEADVPSADENGTEKKQSSTSAENQTEKEREEKNGRSPGNELGQNPDSKFDPTQEKKRAGAEEISEDDTQAQTRSNLRSQPKLSPDKAKLLLDAMRNVELQYLQQLPKKSTKKPDPALPDW